MVTVSRAERVVVGLTGGPEGQVLLRRAALMLGRSDSGRLYGVHVARPGPHAAADPAELARMRALTEDLGGTAQTLVSDDPAQALLDFARSVDATQVVVGTSRRGRLRSALRAGVGERVVATADLDVIMVSHAYARGGGADGAQLPGALSRRRRLTGWVLAVLGPPALVLLGRTSTDSPSAQALTYLALTVLCALVGGLWPAIVAAVLGSVLLNYYFTPPVHTLTVDAVGNVVTLVLFLVVAVAVASVVDAAARRAVQADRARREADALSMLNRALLQRGHGTDDLLRLVCDTFAMSAAALVRSTPDGGWTVLRSHGDGAPTRPEAADVEAPVSADARLLLRGRPLPAHDLRVLSAFATHLAVVLERQRLAARAEAAARLEQGNRLRTALLAAVSHDLRTPLAGIKAAVSTLRSPDLEWSPEDRADLLAAIEDSTDRLAAIVANLLDLSRLQTGGVTLATHEVGLDDVAARALAGLPDDGRVAVDLPEDLPAVRVDAGLLERVVANLVDNALRHTAGAVRVDAVPSSDHVLLRVVDHGPGVPPAARERMFAPFQRLGDTPAGAGVGLGLAVAKGLTEAMAGTLTASDTPGGGLTMTVELPAAAAPSAVLAATGPEGRPG